MKNVYVKFWHSYLPAFAQMNKTEGLEMLAAMLNYRASQVEPHFPLGSAPACVWAMIKNDIDLAIEAERNKITGRNNSGRNNKKNT